MNRYPFLMAGALLAGSLCLATSPASAESCARTQAQAGAATAEPASALHRCPNFASDATFEKQGILPSPFYGDETLAPHFVHSQFVTVCKGMARVHSVSFLPDANTPHYFVARGSCL